MSNRIEELFGGLQSDIKSSIEQFDCNTSSTLGITLYSAEELIEMGFVSKNINLIMDKISNEDIDEFYELHLKDLTVSQLGSVVVDDNTGIATLSQFILAIKKSALYGYLNRQLSSYLVEIKGGKSGNNVH